MFEEKGEWLDHKSKVVVIFVATRVFRYSFYSFGFLLFPVIFKASIFDTD